MSLLTMDDSISSKLTIIALSNLLFYTLYLISAVLSQFIRSYTLLKTKEKIFWHMTVVRAIFGVYGTYVGLWAIFGGHNLKDNIVWGKDSFSSVAVAATVGFFIFECSIVTVSDLYYGNFQVLLNLHHWLGLLNFALCLGYGCGYYFACVGLMLEMSTPSSAICWTLLKCNKSRTFIWKANQFLLVHLFHLRSVVEAYMWYLTYQYGETIYKEMPVVVLVTIYTGLIAVTFVMTPYWTFRKTQQLIIPFDFNFQPTVPNGDLKRE